MSQDSNLAKVFSDLANDPSWPWEVYHDKYVVSKDKHSWKIQQFIAHHAIYNTGQMYFIADSPLTMARLALMVVEIDAERIADLDDVEMSERINQALQNFGINPDDYANVKKRVDEDK